MLGIVVHLAHRHLVRAPVALGALAVDLLRAGPALGRAQHDHRPARPLRHAVTGRLGLDRRDLGEDGVERRGHQLVHRLRIVALDEIRRVAVAAEELLELLVADAGEHGGIGDLVAVQVQDRQHRPVGQRVQELVRVPARRQRPGLRLAVADDAGDDQVGIVEGGAVGVRQRIAELAALVDRPGRLRRHVARDAAGKGELGEEPLHARLVLRDVRIDLAVGAFEIGVGDQRRPAVAGTGDVDHVEVVLPDHPVQVHVDEVQARRRAPVAEQPRLDVLAGERLLQQRVVVEIDLADRQVVRGPPVGIQQLLLLDRQGSAQRLSPSPAGVSAQSLVHFALRRSLTQG